MEEHVLAEQWWTGNPNTDPWQWRQILASDDDIVYGKFFNKSAGFISKDFFPVFDNYRRNGYDFDALFEDELASYRAKKIMDLFELDEEAVGRTLISPEVKDLAGFGKDGGEKNYEGTITELQMQTYLIISDFRQRKNKNGQTYGWHIAVMQTPETKWGRDFVTAEYSLDPKESWNKLITRLKDHFPEAKDAQIKKILGIRYPGETIVAQQVEKKQKILDLPWPQNLITEIGLDRVFPSTGVYQELSADQMVGLLHVLDTLKDNEQTAIRLRMEEHKTLQETAEIFGLSVERIRQIVALGVKKLRSPMRLKYFRDGYEACMKKEAEIKTVSKNTSDRNQQITILKEVRVGECGLSVRACNCLILNGLYNLGMVVELMDRDSLELLKVRSLGKESLKDTIEKLEEYGVDCYEARKACNLEAERRESIMELNPSMRLFNILFRAGLETIEKVQELIEKDPERLVRMGGLGKKTREELFEKLEEKGIDCSPARAVFNPQEGRKEELAALGVSNRLYNILIHADLETIDKIKDQMDSDPWNIIRLHGLGKKLREELFEKLERAGVDCSGAREKAKELCW